MAAMLEEADSANNACGVDEIFHARKFGNGESISRPQQPGTSCLGTIPGAKRSGNRQAIAGVRAPSLRCAP